MQKLSEKIKIMLDKGEDHILWMNFRFDFVKNEYVGQRLHYKNEQREFDCVIDFPRNNNKWCISFAATTKHGYVSSHMVHEEIDEAWHEALRKFRTQTMLTTCNMYVAADHLRDVCNHFLKSDENFNDLIIPER